MPAHIYIATPCYHNRVTTNYAESLIGYTKVPGLKFEFDTLINESLIPRARNRMFSKYQFEFNIKGFTHLFWQDDDVYVDGEALLKVAEMGLDVVGFATPLKHGDYSRGISCAVAGVYEEVSPLLYKARCVGAAALLMSNRAVEALTDYCWESGDIYYEIDSPNELYDVFKTGVVNGIYLSEDWYICRTLRKLGFDIYVDSSSKVIHSGEYGFWVRDAMPIDKRYLDNPFRDPLPKDLQFKFWTPNDSKNPYLDDVP
jgi:hypothetical protein